MASVEFAEWWEMHKLEPWGDDWRQASLVAVSNLQPWTQRRLENDRFVPRHRPRKTVEELESQMQSFAQMHNRVAR